MTSKTIRTEDRDGRAIVRVELINRPDVFVTVDADNFDAWIANGLPVRWYLNRNGSGTARVCFCDLSHRGQNAGVARRLLNLRPQSVVKYMDGDPLNLRSSNLRQTSGWAKGATLTGRCVSDAPADEQPAAASRESGDTTTAMVCSRRAAMSREHARIRVAAGGGVSQFSTSTTALLVAAIPRQEMAHG